MEFLLLDLGLQFGNVLLLVVFGVGVMGLGVLLGVFVEPVDGEADGVGGPLLDDAVDEGFHEDVDLGVDVLFDL